MDRNLRVLEYYKIIDRVAALASSEQGKARVKDITPSQDPGEVRHLQQLNAEMTGILIAKGQVPFGPLYALDREIKMAEIGSTLVTRALLQIGDSLRTARNVHHFIMALEEVTERYPGVYGIISAITPLREVEEAISHAILGENLIADHASPALNRIRRAIERMQASIRSKLESYTHSTQMSRYLQDALVTIRNDRFVIPVKAEHKGMVKGMVHDQSGSGSTVYIEPMAIVEMNNELSQLRLDEAKEIERILKELSARVGAHAEEIRVNFSSLIEVDVLLAKGRYSVEIGGIEPMPSEREVVIRQGRHPLLDRKTVVPLNLHMGGTFGSLLITGPNTGGKTVTLKTVGLFCLMHQAGLHVPAQYGTRLPVFDAVFADIGDEQSIEQSLSTFSSHMTNIVSILASAGPDSLVLLDELGAGTDPVEGAALAMSILQELNDRGIRTLATTHYSELKHYALSKEGFENASVEFDVETLKPTYRLLIGVPGKSNAFEISGILGLDPALIEKARGYLDTTNIEFEEILEKINHNLSEAERDRSAAIQLKLEAEKLKAKLDGKEEKLEQARNKAMKDAKEEARRILADAKSQSEALIRELRGMQTADNKRIEELRGDLRDQIKKTAEVPVTKKRYDHPERVKVGQVVRILDLDTEGDVLTDSDRDGNFHVQAGIMKVKVNVKDVIMDTARQQREEKTMRSYTRAKRQDIHSEVDLRGMNLDEAMMAVDKYLDDAFMARLEEVRIIHGKGTGVLRKGLKEYLKRHKHVKSQRDGTYHEGGIGVTMVVIK